MFLKKEGRKCLFNDALNTFYLQLYGVIHMVKGHSDREWGNPLPPHWLLFPISSKGLFICISHRQNNTYHGVCYTSRGALAGTRNSSMGPPWRIDSTTHRTMSERSYHGAASRSVIEEDNISVLASFYYFTVYGKMWFEMSCARWIYLLTPNHIYFWI